MEITNNRMTRSRIIQRSRLSGTLNSSEIRAVGYSCCRAPHGQDGWLSAEHSLPLSIRYTASCDPWPCHMGDSAKPKMETFSALPRRHGQFYGVDFIRLDADVAPVLGGYTIEMETLCNCTSADSALITARHSHHTSKIARLSRDLQAPVEVNNEEEQARLRAHLHECVCALSLCCCSSTARPKGYDAGRPRN